MSKILKVNSEIRDPQAHKLIAKHLLGWKWNKSRSQYVRGHNGKPVSGEKLVFFSAEKRDLAISVAQSIGVYIDILSRRSGFYYSFHFDALDKNRDYLPEKSSPFLHRLDAEFQALYVFAQMERDRKNKK